jgi:MFS family permease
MIDETEEVSSEKYFIFIKELIKNKKYIFTMFGISCMLFIVTGIQFWISDYMQEVLGISRSYVYIIYSIICISAPTLGVLLGGIFIQYLGGYTNKRALDACFKIAILAALSGAFLPLFDVPWIFVISMWLLLFFGGSVTPGLTGIMIASIPESYKGLGNSLTQLCYNLVGYLPSPFIYGFVCKHTGGNKSRWGLAVLLLWAYFGVFFLYLARKFDNEKDEEIDELDEKLINVNSKRSSKGNEEILDKDNNNDNYISEKIINNENNNNIAPAIKKSSKNVFKRQESIVEKSNIITKLFGRTSAVPPQ